MPTFFLLALATFSAQPIDTGDFVSYRGEMIAKRGNPAETRKTFTFTLIFERVDQAGATLCWTVAEEGQGTWPWPQHFGRVKLDRHWRTASESAPSLLYQHEAGLSPVRIPLPLADWSIDAVGKTWSAKGLDFEVTGDEPIGNADCWKVEARNAYGLKRIAWHQKDTPLLATLAETVFLGAGKEHALRYEVQLRKKLTPAELDAAVQNVNDLVKVREQLGYKPLSKETNWSDQQLDILRAGVDALASDRDDALPPLKKVIQEVETDLKQSSNRSRSLAANRNRLTAAQIGQLKLHTLGEEPATMKDLLAAVTVLHFWEYQDAPLEQPYGQVGYLDFLFRQHDPDRVRIYGVSADPRLADPATRRASIVSAKKLKAFMNLGYPVLLDDGSVLKTFGDPRATGAKLPLFVVLDGQGNLIHYHIGSYEVDQRSGLKELQEVIQKALETGE